MTMMNTRGQRITFHVLGWLLLALTVVGWTLMAVSGMLDRLAGAPDVYSGMEKEEDAMATILVFVPMLPLWLGSFLSLRKATCSSSIFGRTIYGVGIAGIILTVLIAMRLATLK